MAGLSPRSLTLLPGLAAALLHGGGVDLRIENTNFLLSRPDLHNTKRYAYDYDRLRFTTDATHGKYFLTLIADAVNYLGDAYVKSGDFDYLGLIKPDIPFKTKTERTEYGSGRAYAKLHRLYGGYEDDRQRVTVGIQKISMGVGRIWTPTDLYNPKNAYALEPDEVFGVLAVNYAYAPTELSTLNAVVSMREDRSFKYAARYKGYFSFADMGIDLIRSNDTLMVGYEIEGNVFDTGAEWRSEGGYYRNDPLGAEFFQGILGADYGFENGVTAAVEFLYSSQTFTYVQLLGYYESEIAGNMVLSPLYLGGSLMYDFNLAFSGSLLYIESFNDVNSRFVAPSLTYTLNDHNAFGAGALLGFGPEGSEFRRSGQSYFLKWTLSF